MNKLWDGVHLSMRISPTNFFIKGFRLLALGLTCICKKVTTFNTVVTTVAFLQILLYLEVAEKHSNITENTVIMDKAMD